ncbi:MAG: trigger factor [Patescibacteria group bacterium]
MKTDIKKLPKGLVEITFEISPEEMAPYLERAAVRVSERVKIPGFRPGKAPLNVVISNAGEMAVWEEAAEEAVRKTYSHTVEQEKFSTIGSPHIEVLKLAPKNAFSYKATVPLLPEVTMGDLSSLKIEQKLAVVEEKQIEKALHDLRKMQSQEIVSAEPLQKTGKALVDMSISMDGVPVSGGEAKEHSIYMDEEYYIPGLKEKLLGAKKGDSLSFKLPFSKEHFQKNLAGREADFKVDIKDVYELKAPELDDAFAKTLSQESLDALKVIIRKNMELEAAQKNDDGVEIELLGQATQRTTFGEIPDILVNEEVIKMIHELKDGISRQGMPFEDYLLKISKTLDQLKLDFVPEAMKRVKTAILLRFIVSTQALDVSAKETDNEVARVSELYKNDHETRKAASTPEARAYLKNFLLNRKAIDWLKAKAGLAPSLAAHREKSGGS